MSTSDANHCLDCGACCAFFRVSFYWAEAEARGIPADLTEPINPRFSCMAGTNQRAPRCDALAGEVGQRVGCTIYEHRPAPCREVQPGDDQCNKARAGYGLPAIEAWCWQSPIPAGLTDPLPHGADIHPPPAPAD